MTARSLMVQGTASSVGKSLLVTALCRIFKRRGLRVAPFKSQNMSLNSFITAEGLEMGRAQVAQAEAAGLAPVAAMNPVLLKPSADHMSQVIVTGKVLTTLDARSYYAFRHQLKAAVQNAYDSLAAQYDLIIIEGAGSPAEINLRKDDIANMGMAGMADAPVLLMGDIDRGGVFAALYGTVSLLPMSEQKRIRGFVINKFRGDPGILEPGLTELEDLLRRPVLGVLPYWDVRIDEEDSLTERLVDRDPPNPAMRRAGLEIVVARLPRMSNFTDFAVFDALPGLSLRYAGTARQMGRPHLVIIPGSKNSLGDMRFLYESGMADRILELHAQGVPVIGICGGFQMLGRTIRDPHGVESGLGEIRGLGLLAMDSVLKPEKRTVQSRLRIADHASSRPRPPAPQRAEARAGASSAIADAPETAPDTPDTAPGLLKGMAGLYLKGYEIHMGETRGPALERPLGFLDDTRPEGAVNAEATVFGSYLHGIFDNIPFTERLLNNLAEARGLPPLQAGIRDYADFREREYDRLADMVEKHIKMDILEDIIYKRRGR